MDACTLVGNDAGLQVDNASAVTILNTIAYSNTVNWVKYDTSSFAFTNSCTSPAYPGWDASNITNNPRVISALH